MVKIPRGTFDINKNDLAFRQYVINDLFTLAKNYGYQEIQTPIFESTDLFKRAVGNDTDVAQKEMYTFLDRKERSLSLRPELTAPVVRSYVENKMYAQDPKEKFFYYGPCFRYERPQKGRFRQFHQFGVENFGVYSEFQDAETIILALSILKHFNIHDDVTLKINTIGHPSERKEFNEKVKKYFNDYTDEMCEDCKNRLETNPLRIYDCKVDNQKEFVKSAPRLYDSLSKEVHDYFNNVLELLDENNIKYEIDYHLVRGLDYYNDIVFEFVNQEGITLIGGGRYNYLVKELDGPDVPAIGFGMGIERFLNVIIDKNKDVLEDFKQEVDLVFAPLNQEGMHIALKSISKLRYHGLRCEMFMEQKSLKANFKLADKLKAIYVVIIGEDEIKGDYITVKNLITKQENKMKIDDFEESIIMEESPHE